MDPDDAVEVYVREVASIPPLTKEEEAHLFQLVAKRGEQAENAERRLLESSLRLVVPIAQGHSSSGLSVLDLIQEGNRGLIRAVHSFPQTRLDDFSSYAVTCIEEAVSEAIAKARAK